MLEPDHALMSRALGTTRFETSIVTTQSIENEVVDRKLHPACRKRERQLVKAEDSWMENFSIRPYPSSVYAKPQELIPLLITSRSNISLAYLDPVAKTSLPSSRLFSGRIRALHDSTRNRPENEAPALLVARLLSDGSVHALEEVEANVYACCKIGDWVKLESLRSNAWLIRSKDYIDVKDSVRTRLEENESILASSQNLEHHDQRPNKRKRLERSESIQMLMRKRPLIPTPPHSDPMEQNVESYEPERIDQTLPEELSTEQTIETAPSAILETLRDQYLDTLYMSKASLAYFAKGPLSRARAACLKEEPNSFSHKDLSNLLQTLIYPLPALEKKYNSTIPGMIESFAPGIPSDEDEEGDTQSLKPVLQKGTSKQRKVRIGKNGLHLQEPKLLERWWKIPDAGDYNFVPGETRDQEVKKRLAQLRLRETQLQIILILETMALDNKSEEEDSELKSANQDQENPLSKPNKRPSTKRLNLSVLVDLHVDRLTIWQSLHRDNGLQTGDASLTLSNVTGASTGGSMTGGINNELGQFAAEVIIPFFAARVPEKCRGINKSLGGPPMSRAKKSSIKSSRAKDGASTKDESLQCIGEGSPRTAPNRISTAGRVSKRPMSAPRLSRSVTAPEISSLKREDSQPLTLASNRGPAHKSKALSRREVDLTSAIKLGHKNDKKASVEAAIKEAISTLKAPNRKMAVKDVSQSVDRQVKGASMNTKYLRKPLRVLPNQGIQVMATPKRHRNSITSFDPPVILENDSPVAMRIPHVRDHRVNHIIPASATKPSVLVVPESSPPPMDGVGNDRHPHVDTDSSQPRTKPYFSLATLTPVASSLDQRRPKTAGVLDSCRKGTPSFFLRQSSPSKINCEAVEETPSKRRLSCGAVLHPPALFSLNTAQTRDTSFSSIEEKGLVISSSPPIVETSIYDTLGWDNDDDPF